MSREMWWPQSITVEGILYVSDRQRFSSESHNIHRYDLQTQQWQEAIQYQYGCCGMTTVSSQLMMVGGKDVSTSPPEVTNAVAVYSTSQMRWEQPYPPMNTPCMLPAVSTYHQRLVVAGGSDGVNDLAKVEILDVQCVSHSQWFSAMPLPVSCSLMSAAIIHDTLYLLGGTLHKQVLRVSLPALTQSDKLSAQWCTLPDAPMEYSTAIAVHGSLLAVGGSTFGQRTSAIHVYDQEKNTWNKVGDLPSERSYCACCLLLSGEILVAGGQDCNNKWASRMDVAAVKD